MANAKAIAAGIIDRVNRSKTPNFKAWRIGLTHDVQQRYQEWGKPTHFLYWEADSLDDAQAIEAYFINEKGMEGGTGGDLNARRSLYVYIF